MSFCQDTSIDILVTKVEEGKPAEKIYAIFKEKDIEQ